jgi:serine/threonine protein phosphatase 1
LRQGARSAIIVPEMTPGFQSPPTRAAAPTSHGTFTIPEGRRVYAVGDIHGRADLLARLHKKIAADALNTPGFCNVIVYLGDYVDRGPDVPGVLDILINHPLDGFEHHHLKGNHEDIMIRFLDTADGLDGWLRNGGRDTMAGYGIEVSDTIESASDPERLSRQLADAVAGPHRAFLDTLKIRHTEGGALFVHAGIRPGVALEQQDDYDLMWVRKVFIGSDADHGCRVVHGHTIEDEPEVRANRIGIDTGAWRSGILTVAVLQGDDVRFLQT